MKAICLNAIGVHNLGTRLTIKNIYDQQMPDLILIAKHMVYHMSVLNK